MPFRYELFLEELLSLVQSGEIPMDRINDSVERILRVKFVAGLFEHPFTDRSLLELVGSKVVLHSEINLIVQLLCSILRTFASLEIWLSLIKLVFER